MKKESNRLLIYEIKCRKCSGINEKEYSKDPSEFIVMAFQNFVNGSMNRGILDRCSRCDQNTVHDMIGIKDEVHSTLIS